MKEFGVVIGTHEEIEAQLKNAYESPARSSRREAETLEVAKLFLHGQVVFWWGKELYIVSPEGEDKVTPEQIGNILMGYLS